MRKLARLALGLFIIALILYVQRDSLIYLLDWTDAEAVGANIWTLGVLLLCVWVGKKTWQSLKAD